MRAGFCRLVAAWAMVMASATAMAQVIPPSAQPGRERERFTQPSAPLSQPGGAAISLPSTVAPPGADKTKLFVRAIQIVGMTVYTQEQMAPLYADLIKHEVTLQAIYDLAQKITAKYGNDGYVITRAIVPPQEIDPKGATVRIQVIEGYVDRVEWPSALKSYVNFFDYYTSRITAERPSNIRTIERYLLLAGDLPGLKFKNSLKPSPDHPGAATLVVEVTEKRFDALARVDNRGPPGQGPLEFLATGTINNLFHIHDAFTFTYAGPFKTEELKYIYGQYSQVLMPEGLQFFINASDGVGRPGTPELQALDYRTKSAVAETGLSFPWLRTRERNLSTTLLAFASNNQQIILDAPDTPPSTLDKIRGFRFKVNADAADPLNAINQLNLIVSQGIQGLGSTTNGSPLASRLNGQVDFTKIEATGTRLQPLPQNFSLLLAAYGQYAGTPLLNPEQCGYGGRVFGRAFYPSQFVADECFEALGELRYDVQGMPKEFTQTQLYGFVDNGWLHNLAPDVGTPRNVVAASAGGGVRFGLFDVLSADLSAAKAVEAPARGTQNAWQFFFILSAKY
jgi:hemolysin activation/secretion protein